MTVSELRTALAGLPGDALVVLAKDAEGNRFGPLDDVLPGLYTPLSPWRGEFENVGVGEPVGGQWTAISLWPA